MRQLSHGPNAQMEQFLCSRTTHEKQVADGKPPHLLLYLFLPQRMDPVRLLEVGRHLCQQLIFRDSDIDRKSQHIPDLIPDPLCGSLGAAPQLFCSAHVHECLVHGILLHVRRVLPQDIHKCSRTFLIQPVIRRDQDQIRTFAQRLYDGFTCLNAIPLRRNRFRQNDPMTQRRIPAYRGDLFPKILSAAQMVQAVRCFPA